MFAYKFIIERDTETETQRHRDRETERQRETERVIPRIHASYANVRII